MTTTQIFRGLIKYGTSCRVEEPESRADGRTTWPRLSVGSRVTESQRIQQVSKNCAMRRTSRPEVMAGILYPASDPRVAGLAASRRLPSSAGPAGVRYAVVATSPQNGQTRLAERPPWSRRSRRLVATEGHRVTLMGPEILPGLTGRADMNRLGSSPRAARAPGCWRPDARLRALRNTCLSGSILCSAPAGAA